MGCFAVDKCIRCPVGSLHLSWLSFDSWDDGVSGVDLHALSVAEAGRRDKAGLSAGGASY